MAETPKGWCCVDGDCRFCVRRRMAAGTATREEIATEYERQAAELNDGANRLAAWVLGVIVLGGVLCLVAAVVAYLTGGA